MSDDQRKSPFADVTAGDEEEWEKALDSWDSGDDADQPPPAAVPPAPPATKGPLYHPPSPALPTPVPPKLGSASHPFAGFEDDDADEATTVSRIPPELLAGTTLEEVPSSQSSGLGHVLRREDAKPASSVAGRGVPRPTADPPETPPAEDQSVVTSARTLPPGSGYQMPDEERTATEGSTIGEVPDGDLFEPFVARHDPSVTVRPGPSYDERVVLSGAPDVPRPAGTPDPTSHSARGVPRPGTAPPPGAARMPVLVAAETTGADDAGQSTVTVDRAEETEREETAGPETAREAQPSARASMLRSPEQLEAWQSRASWLEQEARAAIDRGTKARGLLVASELFALAGDARHAHELALEARDLSPNHPLLHRQSRALPLRERDFGTVTQLLQAESRAAATPAVKAHGALFAAGLARLEPVDDELASKRLDQAVRAHPSDPRAYVNRIASAIAASEPLPKTRWPDAPELAPLADASATLQRWRGVGERPATSPDEGARQPAHPVDALLSARDALATRDLPATLRAVEALGSATGLLRAAGWLSAAMALAHATQESDVFARLTRLAEGPLARTARRAFMARALEENDGERARAALHDAAPETFDAADRAVLGVLADLPWPALAESLDALGQQPAGRALEAPLRAAFAPPGSVAPGETVDRVRIGASWVRLARLLAAGAGEAELTGALRAVEENVPGSALARVLATELDLATGRIDKVAETLATDSGERSPDELRDRGLLAGLLFELTGNAARARAPYQSARSADPSCEAAVRAEIAVSGAEVRADLLIGYEAALEDASAAALTLLEAAHGDDGPAGDKDRYMRLLTGAQKKAPWLPFAAWLAERKARANGDFETIVEWLRERRQASEDPIEQAHDLAREALLIADRDLEVAKELLEQASRARPTDLALRELYERLSPDPPPDRAAYWAERALAAEGAERARLALFAALEFEKGGFFDDAARLAEVSLEAQDGKFARMCVERNEARGGRAANLAEHLIQVARGTDDPHARLEAYERLADLDEVGRGDAASAVLWHQSILEDHPGFLPSLCRLEHWLIGDGREDELETIAFGIARALSGPESIAHAELAARLRTRSGPWQSALECVRIAYARDEPPFWALREMEAHSALANDAATELDVARRLAASTTRPLEVATLELRAAEAAMRADDFAQAKALLLTATGAFPAHIVVQRTLAEVSEKLSDFGAAAEAWEAVAALAAVPAHQLEAHHRAAVLWLDRGVAARGRAALEAAARIDVTYLDVFSRLQAVYVAAADREALAGLLEARLAGVRDPAERVELEIVRGTTLAEIGEVDAAKQALLRALEVSPDHAGALKAFADICARQGHWEDAEEAMVRLVRLVPDSAEQAALYMRLGDLYDRQKPNPERAELAYREVLRRLPGDVSAQERLVDIYIRTGDAPRALEIAQALLAAARSQEDKRKRTIELARVHEEAARDPKKSEALLEAARKEFPGDIELLSALVGFYRRTGKASAVTLLLDRAASDARRALSTGRFDVALFSTLSAVARLREREQAAAIAEATVAAIEGRPSDLPPAGMRAGDPALDDSVAPELLSSAFRVLLHRAGEVLDAAVPVDLKGLRVAPLPPAGSGTAAEIQELARGFGIEGLEVFVSPALGAVCLPASAEPPQIVLGQPLLTSNEDAVRRFLVTRALKIVSARVCALSRSAPIDLLPLVSAFLLLFAPDWQPAQVDTAKLREMHARLLRAKPPRVDPEMGLLALEVIGSLGNRTSTLHTVVNAWGNRVALLASGDLSTALSAIARAAGHTSGPAAGGPERVTWIGRNAEARDLVVFTVGDAYAEVRAKLGV